MIYIVHTHGYAMKIVSFSSLRDVKLYLKRVNPIQYVIIQGEYIESKI